MSEKATPGRIRVLRPTEVERALPMDLAIAATRELLVARKKGELVSGQRSGIEVGATGLIWTPGGHAPTKRIGLRLYLTNVPEDDQVVAVWDTVSGQLQGLVVGAAFGAIRTGAIGGVAIDVLARKDSRVLAVIGLGSQARRQVEACLVVRPIEQVRLYRRSQAELAAEADQLAARWGVEVVACSSAEQAVRTADIVVTATSSIHPVLEASWLVPGTHLSVLGPKWDKRAEVPLDAVSQADVILSDFPEQFRAEAHFMLASRPEGERMGDLADHLDGGRHHALERTCFLSHGLSGTEPWLLDAALKEAERLSIGQLV